MKKTIIIMLFALVTNVYAQKPAVSLDEKAGWHKISETTVGFKTEKDEIVVMGADKFKALKFKVTEGAIDLQDLEVHYSEGDKEDIQVRTPILEGGESRVIDLKGYARDLKKVVFVYRTIKDASKDRAHVELYGLK
jgi:hypothetical protein